MSDGETTPTTPTTPTTTVGWGAAEVAALRHGSEAAWLHTLVRQYLLEPDTDAVDTAAQFVVGLLEHSCEQLPAAPFAAVWDSFCSACKCCLDSGGLCTRPHGFL